MRKTFLLAGILFIQQSMAQQKMSPELLWQLGRVGGETVTEDGTVVYGVSRYNLTENKSEKNLYTIPLMGGTAQQLTSASGGEAIVQALPGGGYLYLYKGQLWQMDKNGGNPVQKTHVDGSLQNVRISPTGSHMLYSKEVKLEKISGADRYADLPKSNAQVYTTLNYRHWDTWEDGSYNHVFYATWDAATGKVGEGVDIMKDELFDCPTMPFGGVEDMIWSPDGSRIIYVSKKLHGTAYAVSTNTDIYSYDLASGKTENLSEGMKGYDVAPVFSADGKKLLWLSMKHDGFEADKNDVVIYDLATRKHTNLTAAWDGTVNAARFSNDGKKIWFLAIVKGTEHLFELNPVSAAVRQVTKGTYDINGFVGEASNHMVVTRADMNHAAELYTVNLSNGEVKQLSTVNNDTYGNLQKSKVEERWVKTTDGQQMLVWVIFPPNFDPNKKYPTLLYCQGGPQSAVSQFYSFRWNFQLMAAQGYIVVAPNRRGMPGHGVKWNADISKDWGGQPIRDYLAAIDDVAKAPYVDKARLGAVGASYGGYSVFMLAGVHEKRFKSFIAHDGLFDLRSWYGTTEEMWFANWDIGAYYDKTNAKTHDQFNPINFVNNWNTPIMIVQGGTDYRVGIEQGLQAFQVAQLKGIKSKLVYFPEENHWVLSNQNALVWQREFFSWLKETL